MQAALARLCDEQQNTSTTVRELMNTIDERDRTIALQRNQFEAELEGSRQSLDSVETSHRADD